MEPEHQLWENSGFQDDQLGSFEHALRGVYSILRVMISRWHQCDVNMISVAWKARSAVRRLHSALFLLWLNYITFPFDLGNYQKSGKLLLLHLFPSHVITPLLKIIPQYPYFLCWASSLKCIFETFWLSILRSTGSSVGIYSKEVTTGATARHNVHLKTVLRHTYTYYIPNT